MTKYFFIAVLLILLLFSSTTFAQTDCTVSQYYGDFITIRKYAFDDRDGGYLVKQAVETNSANCFSTIVNDNISFINYLLTNFSSNANYQELLKIEDSVKLQSAYISQLQDDSMFNAVMTDLSDKTFNKLAKDTVTLDHIMSIAVKYFTILKINEEGDYVGKVCAGINGIKSTEAERRPFVEAFCFSSVLENYEGDVYNMYNEFVNALKALYKINMGVDKGEKLLRAQGAMFTLMYNNQNLRSMLLKEYEIKKDYLPFVISASH